MIAGTPGRAMAQTIQEEFDATGSQYAINMFNDYIEQSGWCKEEAKDQMPVERLRNSKESWTLSTRVSAK